MTAESFSTRVLRALDRKGAQPVCAQCGNNQWSVVDHPVRPMLADAADPTLPPHAGSALAVVFCGQCGFVRYHRLSVLGIEG